MLATLKIRGCWGEAMVQDHCRRCLHIVDLTAYIFEEERRIEVA